MAVAVAAYRLEHIRAPSLGPGSRPIPSCRHFLRRLQVAGSDAGEEVVNPGKNLGAARSGVPDDKMAASNRRPAAVHPVQSDGRGGNQEESTQRLVVVHPGQWDALDRRALQGVARFRAVVARVVAQ